MRRGSLMGVMLLRGLSARCDPAFPPDDPRLVHVILELDALEDGPVRGAVLAGGLDRITWRDYDWRLPERTGSHPRGKR
jgi:hypothetical protein